MSKCDYDSNYQLKDNSCVTEMLKNNTKAGKLSLTVFNLLDSRLSKTDTEEKSLQINFNLW
jgi:hypothetical protein